MKITAAAIAVLFAEITTTAYGLKSSGALGKRAFGKRVSMPSIDAKPVEMAGKGIDTMNEYANTHKDIKNIFDQNAHWVKQMKNQNPSYFDDLGSQHKPGYMWIGCSDARVPGNVVVGEDAGSVFTVRNVANTVCGTDYSLMSALQYAVGPLNIPHIVVCGHYDCGGVRASMANQDHAAPLENWLRNIRDVYRLHRVELDGISDPEMRHRRLVELNVVEQCINLYKTGAVQRKRKESGEDSNYPYSIPRIHAVVYDPKDGLVKPLEVDFYSYQNELGSIYDMYTFNYARSHKDINNIFTNNRNWVSQKTADDPDFFKDLGSKHTPSYMWIGCSDARVPANVVMGEDAGSVFVVRNVANTVCGTDFNLLSAVQYAVGVLNVPHIIVCGHYECGGVRASSTNHDHEAPLENWLRNIRDVYRLHQKELDAIDDPEDRHKRLVELNVVEQCVNLYKVGAVQRRRMETAQDSKRPFSIPRIHACVFDPASGSLRELDVDFEAYRKELRSIYDMYEYA